MREHRNWRKQSRVTDVLALLNNHNLCGLKKETLSPKKGIVTVLNNSFYKNSGYHKI